MYLVQLEGVEEPLGDGSYHSSREKLSFFFSWVFPFSVLEPSFLHAFIVEFLLCFVQRMFFLDPCYSYFGY